MTSPMEAVDEMVTVFMGDSLETEMMPAVVKKVMENMNTYMEGDDRVMATIKALIDDIDEEKEAMDEVKRSGCVEEQLSQVECDGQRVKRRVAELNDVVSVVNDKIEELRKERERITAKHKEMRASLRQSDLYNSVAQIRWQIDADFPDLVKGTVVNKSAVRPFSLDKKQYSETFICNYIWSLMEPDW